MIHTLTPLLLTLRWCNRSNMISHIVHESMEFKGSLMILLSQTVEQIVGGGMRGNGDNY